MFFGFKDFDLKHLLRYEFNLWNYEPAEGDDHDHCDGCFAKFMKDGMNGTLAEGYRGEPKAKEEDNVMLLCKDCYQVMIQIQEQKVVPLIG